MAVAITVVILLAVMAAVVYAFLIMPRITDAADMELQSTDYAHRGLWNRTIPENSLPAFKNAAIRSYGIELDLQLSRDGKVFVFHDDTLMRMCGVEGRISDYTEKELKQLSLAGTGCAIPLLSEVFELIDGRVPLLIEIKGEGRKGEYQELCRATAELLDNYNGAFAVQSFNPLILAWFKGFRPRFARGQIVTEYSVYRKNAKSKKDILIAFALSHMLTNIISRPDFISVEGTHMRSPEVFLITKLFRAKGFVWTVRNQGAYKMTKSRDLFAIFEIIRP